jgi:hypothetical protein
MTMTRAAVSGPPASFLPPNGHSHDRFTYSKALAALSNRAARVSGCILRSSYIFSGQGETEYNLGYCERPWPIQETAEVAA